MGGRLSPPILALIVQTALVGTQAQAADLSPPAQADLRRAYEAAKLSTSEEPAVRAERRVRQPSDAFMLGAALGAWTAAAEQLDFDLKNPAGAGPPHVSQTGANAEALEQDCADETTAFTRLDSRAVALGVTSEQTLRAAGMADKDGAEAWRARRLGPADACR